MEFVLVLPVYIAVLGGTLWLGQRSLDAINLRSADHWTVWKAGNRFSAMRVPAAIGLRGMFPRADLAIDTVGRRLESEHGYLQFIGGGTKIIQRRPDFIDARKSK